MNQFPVAVSVAKFLSVSSTSPFNGAGISLVSSVSSSSGVEEPNWSLINCVSDGRSRVLRYLTASSSLFNLKNLSVGYEVTSLAEQACWFSVQSTFAILTRLSSWVFNISASCRHVGLSRVQWPHQKTGKKRN